MTIALRVGRRDHDTQDFPLAVDAGAYAVTGTAAGLAFGREVSATSGSYALTGTASTFRRSRRIVSTNGSYSITGTAATLNYSAGGQELAWNQVSGNEGYELEWDTDSGVPYANSVILGTDENSYQFSGASDTYYWRVAPRLDGVTQIERWSVEDSFTI